MSKRNSKRKSIVLITCLACAASLLLGACSTPSSQSGAPSSSSASSSSAVSQAEESSSQGDQPAAAGETISYWVPLHSNAAQVLTDWNDNECFQELERQTGVHVNPSPGGPGAGAV